MADRFVVGDRTAQAVQGAWFVLHGAELLAVRTGLGVGQGLGLLCQQGGEGALEQPLSGGLGGLFEGEQIGVQRGAGIAESAAGNDFAPLRGKVTEILEFLGVNLPVAIAVLPWTCVKGR